MNARKFAVNYSQNDLPELRIVMDTDYEAMFADLPDMVGSRDAMTILNVTSIQGVHHVISHLPAAAPRVFTQDFIIGKRKLVLYRKADLIALRRYRDIGKP